MKKLVYGLLLLLAAGIAGTVATAGASGGFSFNTKEVFDEKIIANKDIKNIEIDLTSADLTLHQTSDEDIKVELNGKANKKYSDRFQLDIDENGETLDINLAGEDRIEFNFGINIVDTNVDVYLPERVFDRINAKTSSGDIDASGIKAKEIVLNSQSGDVGMDSSASEGKTVLKTSSGDIQSLSNSAPALDLKSESGDMMIRDQKAKETLLYTSSGDINVVNAAGAVKADSSSGDIHIENKKLTGNIDAEASSGEIIIELDEKPDSLSVDFKGGSGEGTVDLDGLSYEEKSEDEIQGKIGSGKYAIKARTSSGDFQLR
jgi:lia operon protein LiaG